MARQRKANSCAVANKIQATLDTASKVAAAVSEGASIQEASELINHESIDKDILKIELAKQNLDGLAEEAVSEAHPLLFIPELAIDDFLETFDTHNAAWNFVLRTFKNGIVAHTFFTRSRRARTNVVITADEFNLGIQDFKNELCTTIIQNLGLLDKMPEGAWNEVSKSATIFTSEGCNLEAFSIIQEACKDFISGKLKFDITKDVYTSLPDFLVFAATYILNNFDSFVEDLLKDLVDNDSSLKGDLNRTSYAVLQNYTNEAYWNMSDLEYADASHYVSNVAKMIVLTIPQVTIENGRIVKLPDQYLDSGHLFQMAGVLKLAEYEWNIINAQNPAARLDILLDPRRAVRVLLGAFVSHINNPESCLFTIPPVLKTFRDLSLAFANFLYIDTNEEKSVRSISKERISQGKISGLDIEASLTWELSKSVTPVYMLYSDTGALTDLDNKMTSSFGVLLGLINKALKFKLSHQLRENTRKLIEQLSRSQEPILTQSFIKDIENLDWDTLRKNLNFLNLVRTLLGIDISTTVRYDALLKNNLLGLKTLLSKIQSNLIENARLLNNTELLNKIDESLSIIQLNNGKLAEWFKNLAENLNILFASVPVTNFRDINGNSLPVYRLNSAIFDDTFLIGNYKKNNPLRRKTNFFVDLPHVFSNIQLGDLKNGESLEIVNGLYTGSTGIKLQTGTVDNNLEARKLTPFNLFVDAFIGDFLSLRNAKDWNGTNCAMAAVLVAAYSDKTSLMTKILNLLTKIKLNPNDPNELPVKFEDLFLDPDNILLLDYFYRKNQLIDLVNHILKDWYHIAKALGKDFNFEYLTDQELLEIFLDPYYIDFKNSKLGIKFFNNIEKLRTFVQALDKSDLKQVPIVASLLGLKYVEELHYSLYGKLKTPDLNRMMLQDLKNLESFTTFKAVNDRLAALLLNKVITTSYGETTLRNALINHILAHRTKLFKVASNLFDANQSLKAVLLEKEIKNYLFFANFITHQYLDLTTKEPYADPAKKHATIEEEYASRLDATSKRNVIFAGTVENFMLNTLSGVSENIEVAIVEDWEEDVFNPMGESGNLIIYDGAGFISPIWSRMENASLVGKGGSTTKKTLGMFTDDYSSSLFKWAEFEITNWGIRNSGGKGRFNLETIFKKMHSKKFDPGTDFTTNFLGKHINIKNLLNQEDYYFSDGLSYYKLIDITKNPTENSYTMSVLQVDERGNRISSNVITKEVVIDSLYSMWKAFGGTESYSMVDVVLEYSESVFDLIYQLVINTGTLTNGFPKTEFNLSNVKQTLRNKFIGILANKGSVKRGIINLNSKESVWDSDSDLNTFTINTNLFGMLLDARHDADQAEITELSQTLSALAELGRVFDKAEDAYKEVSRIIERSLHKVNRRLDMISKGLVEQVAMELSKLLIQSVLKEGNLGLTMSTIGLYLKEADKDHIIIPFGDRKHGFNSLIIKQIVSDLNKSSLKRKYRGLGGVLNPSSNILQVYNIGDLKFLRLDLVKAGQKLLQRFSKEDIIEGIKRYDPNMSLKEGIELLGLASLNTDDEIDLINLLKEFRRRSLQISEMPGGLAYKYLSDKLNFQELGNAPIIEMMLRILDDFTNPMLAISNDALKPSANLSYGLNLLLKELFKGNYGRYRKINPGNAEVLSTVVIKYKDSSGTNKTEVFLLTTKNKLSEYRDYIKKLPANAEVFVDVTIPVDLKPQIISWEFQLNGITQHLNNWLSDPTDVSFAVEEFFGSEKSLDELMEIGEQIINDPC